MALTEEVNVDKPVSHLDVVSGPPKVGKSTDLGLTFCRGFFFAPSLSALLPIQALGGFIPQKKAVVSAFGPILAWLREHHDDDEVSGVVIDDFSLIADRQMAKWKAGGTTGYDLWNALNDALLELFELAASAPFHTAINSHETGPGESKGTWIPGGPKLPSKNAGDALGKNAGLILRAVKDPTSPAADAWPVIYSCDPMDTGFTTGDRQGHALPQNPLNLREILRLGGTELPRVFDWQEDMVTRLAGLIVEGKLTRDLLDKARKAMTDKYKAPPAAVNWAIRDSRARAYLEKHRHDLAAALDARVLEGLT